MKNIKKFLSVLLSGISELFLAQAGARYIRDHVFCPECAKKISLDN